jgi:hypothetical protein
VLLHELTQTIRALPGIVAGARARGLRFVTLDGSGRADESTQPPGPPRRVASVTPGHTAGLVLDTTSSVERAFLCRDDAVADVGYAVWAAARERAPLILSSVDRLGAPYRMQLQRLAPEALIRVGSAVGVLDGDEGLPARGIDCPDPAQLTEGVEVLGGRWMVTTAAESCTLLAVAATAARVGAGLLVIDTTGTTGADVAFAGAGLDGRGPRPDLEAADLSVHHEVAAHLEPIEGGQLAHPRDRGMHREDHLVLLRAPVGPNGPVGQACGGDPVVRRIPERRALPMEDAALRPTAQQRTLGIGQRDQRRGQQIARHEHLPGSSGAARPLTRRRHAITPADGGSAEALRRHGR